MPAPSNAIATLTIQDQDQLNVALPNIVQRMNASVVFQPLNSILFSGYQVVSSLVLVNLVPALTNVGFAYIRNVNPLSTNNVLIVQCSGQGVGTNTTVNLGPGGIFLFANQFIAGSVPFTSLNNLAVAVAFGASVTIEYMLGY